MSKFTLLLCVIIFASCESRKKNATIKITQSEHPANSVFEQQVDSLRIASLTKPIFSTILMQLADKSLSPYGYGWFIQKYNGHTLVWHYGLQPNAYSGLYLKVLEKDLT